MIARIRGNSKIEGEITVGGAKNSALPILASLVLISEEIKIEKIPDISDVSEMISMIRSAGVAVNFEKIDRYTHRGFEETGHFGKRKK